MIKSRSSASLLSAALLALLLFMASCGRSNDASSAEVASDGAPPASAATATSDTSTIPSSTTSQSAATPESNALDGRRFVVTMGEKGKKESEHDTLHFAAGRFHSIACDQYGFDSASYAATSSHDTTSFRTVTKSVKEGRMEWSGWIAGNAIGGTVVWIKEGQNPIEYWFNGASM